MLSAELAGIRQCTKASPTLTVCTNANDPLTALRARSRRQLQGLRPILGPALQAVVDRRLTFRSVLSIRRTLLFNHLVCSRHDRRQQGDAERACRFQVCMSVSRVGLSIGRSAAETPFNSLAVMVAACVSLRRRPSGFEGAARG